jgi:phosphatidylglycerophosphate synthase
MKKDIFNLANIITLSRLIFLPVLYLFVLLDMRLAFLIAYIIIGSTDFLDGLIARKFNIVTRLGKMLDSIADIPLYISNAFFLYRLYPEFLEPNFLILIIFFIVFFTSFIVSYIKTKKLIMMHTSLLRYNAVLVYFLIISSYFINTSLFVAIVLSIFIIAFIEEIIIFIKFGQVDPDTKSIFVLLKNKKEV